MTLPKLGLQTQDLGYCAGFVALFSLFFVHELKLGDIPTWRALASGLSGVFFARKMTSYRHAWLPLLALLLAYPWEHSLAPTLDPILQLLTAWWAAPLTRLSGLPVTLEGGVDPVLALETVRVHVTSQCAGFQPIIATSSLGLIFAALVTDNNQKRIILTLSIPMMAYLVNVLRIVLSVHAANQWIDQEGAWELAHDVIDYACFGLFYVGLFCLAQMLQRPTSNTKSPAI